MVFIAVNPPIYGYLQVDITIFGSVGGSILQSILIKYTYS